MKKRVVVAMSGGVDSATTAALLKNEGYDVVGLTMQLWDYGEAEGGCCSADEVCDARRVAYDIGIPHYVVNYMDLFKEHVVADFVSKYESGMTPIPCILCNQFMKFNFLLKRALEFGADYLATGHYARVVFDHEENRYYLKKGLDSKKDQSYFLYTLTQKELKRLRFPLGEKTKPEVRDLARKLGVKVAEKSESMGVCFITGSSYREFLEPYLENGKKKGDIVDTEGNFITKHNGIASFTIGQRRGLGFATGEPMYVVRVDPESNTVVVGREDDLYNQSFTAEKMSWVGVAPEPGEKVMAKIRYRHMEEEAYIKKVKRDRIEVKFKNRQKAITPGQAVVFYKNDSVVGGGWINGVLQ